MLKRKNLILLITFIFFILISIVVITAWIKLRANQYSNPTTASLVIIKPDIEVTRANQRIDTTDKPTVDIQAGDTIKTDKNGVGYLIFSDNSSLTIDNNTQVEVKVANDKNDSFEISLYQATGRTWGRVEKLGDKVTSFQIETPDTISDANGTQFGCNVEDQKTTCYSFEHDITLVLKNKDNKSIPLAENKVFENSVENINQDVTNLDSYSGNLASQWTRWQGFNGCLTQKARDLIQGHKDLDYLKSQNFAEECQGELVAVADSNTQVLGDSTIDSSVLASVVSVLDNGDFTQGTISCKWTGINAASYRYAIGTQQFASSDVYNWTDTNDSQFSLGSLNLQYGQTYYCNIIAINPAGESGIYSSDGIIYENAAGSINNLVNNGKIISGNGNYGDAPFADFQLIYQVKGQSDWKTIPIFDQGNGNYNFINIKSPGKITIEVILRSSLSGRWIDSKTI